MASLEELRRERIKKLEALKKAGKVCYPSETSRTHELKDVVDTFNSLEKTKTSIVVSGRVMSSRG